MNGESTARRPGCFGRLDTVFPLREDGLRESPEACLACVDKTACLRAALDGSGGIRVREERVDRAYASGAMGFLERWSRRKALRCRRERERRRGPGRPGRGPEAAGEAGCGLQHRNGE